MKTSNYPASRGPSIFLDRKASAARRVTSNENDEFLPKLLFTVFLFLFVTLLFFQTRSFFSKNKIKKTVLCMLIIVTRKVR